MEEWITKFAGALGAEDLTPGESQDLLLLAREVAHGTGDRRLAPIAAFLAGLCVSRSRQPRPDAIRGALEDLKRTLPAPPGA